MELINESQYIYTTDDRASRTNDIIICNNGGEPPKHKMSERGHTKEFMSDSIYVKYTNRDYTIYQYTLVQIRTVVGIVGKENNLISGRSMRMISAMLNMFRNSPRCAIILHTIYAYYGST